jgi:hypothetical protein
MEVRDVSRTLQELKYLDQAFRLMGCKWDHVRRRVVHLEAHELPYPGADPSKFAGKSVFTIKIKGGGFTTFRPKSAQLRMLTAVFEEMALGLPVFIVILKARQIGFSTCIALLFLALALIKSALDIIVAAHIDTSASNLFSIYKTAYHFLPDDIKPPKEKDNQQELKFAPNQSQLKSFVAKEGNMGVSTSYTHAHFSEIGLWKHNPAETLATALDSIPKMVGTIVFAESTSRGKGNLLHELWERSIASWLVPEQRGLNRKDPWRPLFFAWFDDEDYYLPIDDSFKLTGEEVELQQQFRLTKQQLAWRRAKIAEKAGALGEPGAKAHFNRENPSDPETAFRLMGDIVFDAPAIEWQTKTYQKENPNCFQAYLVPDKRVPTGFKPFVVPRHDGPLRIYRRPEPSGDYLMCMDPTRNEGTTPDDAALQIIDVNKVEVVASYNQPIDPEDFGREAAAIGWYYNEAFCVCESNDAGIGTVRTMYKELGYRRMYRHTSPDKIVQEYSKSLGFPLKGEIRDEVIKNGKRFLREYRVIIPDKPTLNELIAFRTVFDRVRNRFKAQGTGKSKQDNLVMALLIGLYVGNIIYQWHKKEIVPIHLPRTLDNVAESWDDERELAVRGPSIEALLGD